MKAISKANLVIGGRTYLPDNIIDTKDYALLWRLLGNRKVDLELSYLPFDLSSFSRLTLLKMCGDLGLATEKTDTKNSLIKKLMQWHI